MDTGSDLLKSMMTKMNLTEEQIDLLMSEGGVMDYQTEYITENGIEYEVRVYDSVDRYWYLNGERHRENGPALECSNGYREW